MSLPRVSSPGILVLLAALSFEPAFASDLIAGTPTWQYDGSATENWLGWEISGGLDVDADQTPEVAVSVPTYDSGTGEILVFEPVLGVLPSTPTYILPGVAHSEFGFAFEPVGDVNGDGFADVLIGAPPYQSNDGAAFIYYGDPAGPAATPDETLVGEYYDLYGTAVVGLGDVDNDGFDDFAVGATNRQGARSYGYGVVDVYRGGPDTPVLGESMVCTDFPCQSGKALASGDLDGDGDQELIDGATSLDLYGAALIYADIGRSIDTAPTWRLDGTSSAEQFGYALAVGDLDGDGYQDLVVGSPNYNFEVGRVKVFAGDSTGVDASRTLIDLVPPGGHAFGVSLSVIGDIDDDGFEDIAIGETAVGFGAGIIHIMPGSPTGPDIDREEPHDAGIMNDAFGWRVAAAGDVNNDRIPDLLVSTPESGDGLIALYDGLPPEEDTADGEDTADTADTAVPEDTSSDDEGTVGDDDSAGTDSAPPDELGTADDEPAPSKSSCGCNDNTSADASFLVVLAGGALVLRRSSGRARK